MRAFHTSKKCLDRDDKAAAITLLIIMLSLTIILAVFFFNSIRFYSEFDIDYGDLVCEELTFDKGKMSYSRRGIEEVEVYFKEYSEPFYISGIVAKKLDKDSFMELKQGEIIKIYYRQSSHRDYDYSICEMSCDSVMIFSLQYYVEANQNNQIGGMIVFSIMTLGSLCFVSFAVIWLKRISNRKRMLKERM